MRKYILGKLSFVCYIEDKTTGGNSAQMKKFNKNKLNQTQKVVESLNWSPPKRT